MQILMNLQLPVASVLIAGSNRDFILRPIRGICQDFDPAIVSVALAMPTMQMYVFF